MTNLIPLINSSLTPEMQGILYFLSSQACKNSEQIYCAGGFVRDLLLGSENRKLDLIVSGSAVDFAHRLTNVFPGRLTFYERYGTATLILSKGFVFDMVTARKEFNPFHDTNKTVSEEDLLKNDLFERDFTVNTLACSLNQDTFGDVYDYFGGLEDLENKTLRVLYKLSLFNNPLRILRLIRFEQRLNFCLEEETNRLLRQAIDANFLKKVSRESLSREINLFFQEISPVKILSRLLELKLFGQIFPRVNPNDELFKRLNCLEGILHRIEKEKALQPRNRFLLYLCLLFYDLCEHDLQYLCHLMRLKRKERMVIIAVLKSGIDLNIEDRYHTIVKEYFPTSPH